MLSTHYRKTLNFTDEVLETTKKEIAKIENVVKNTSLYLAVNRIEEGLAKKEVVDHMVEALSDDLNTSLAMTEVLDQVKVLNQVMRVREKDNELIADEYATLQAMLDVLGFKFDGVVLSDEDIDLYNQWNAYKKEKNFEEADKLRAQLSAKGIL